MPALLPLVPTLLGAAGVIGATATAWLTVGAALVSAGYAQRKARREERKARDAYNASLQDRLLTIRSAISERRYVLGTVRSSGTLLYAETVGLNNTALDSVVALASNKCEVTDYYFGDERIAVADFPGDHYGKQQEIDAEEEFTVAGPSGSVTLAARPKDGTPIKAYVRGPQFTFLPANPSLGTGTTLNYSGIPSGPGRQLIVQYKIDGSTRMRATFKDGDPNQTPSSWPDHTTPLWTTEHRLRGVAHLRTLMLWDQDLFAAGAPVISAVLKGGWIDGHPFYDPRTGTNPVYTDNPAILAGWWMTLPRNRGGMGIPTDWIDWPSIATAANICDELVTVKKLVGVGTEQIKRYQCHTVLDTSAPPSANLDVILSSMAGRKCFTAGLYRILAGAFRSATLTITDNHLIGTKQLSVVTVGGDDAPPNIVTGRFADATKNWQETGPKSVRNAAYVAADGHEEPIDLSLPATTDQRQANYLMGILIESLRPAFGLTLSVGGIGENIALYDTLQLNLTNRSAYSGKTYEVLKITDNWNGEFDLLIAEIRPQTWALDLNTFTPSNPVPVTDASYLWDVSKITGLLADPGTPQTLPDGNAVTVIELTWNQTTDKYVIEAGHIEVRYRNPGGQWIALAPLPGDSTGTTVSASLADGGVYQFQVRAVNGIGAASRQWADVWVEISGTSLSEGIQGPGIFTWANPTGVSTTSSAITKTGFSVLTNGDFESGTSAGWGVAFEGTVVTGNARTGTYSTRLPSGAGGPNLISDRWAVTPGQVWALQAYVMRDETSLPTAPVSLRVRAYNSSLVQVASTSLTASNISTPGWQALAGNYTVLAGAAFLSVDVGESSGTGHWFVDDVVATPAAWDAGAHSLQSYSVGCFVTARPADIITTKMIGLNNDPDIDANFVGINYAWRADSTGALSIYENGILLSAQGTYTAQTILSISYDGVNVRYFKDGVVARTVAASGLRLFLDVSLFSIGASWADVAFGPQGGAGAAGAPGASAQSVRLSATSYAFTFDSAGAASPVGQSITFTASRQNIVAVSTFSTTPVGVTLTGSGDTRALSIANFGANQNVKVRVDAGGFFDEITVVRLQQGATGPGAIVGVLTNEAHTLAADPDGVVGSFAGASGLFLVYEGIIDRTALATFSIASSTNCTAQINTATNTPVAGQPRGFYRVTAVTADQASVTLRAVLNGVTIDKVFTITRARQGVPGDGSNLLRVDEWVVGQTGGQQPHWIANQDHPSIPENAVVLGGAGTAPLGPLGITEPLWECRPTGNGNADGGWDYVNIPVDLNKTYRSVVWFRVNSHHGQFYHGCGNADGSVLTLAGAINGNPYFVYGSTAALEIGQWYLSVGIIHGAGYTGAYSGIGGVYDPRTGKKLPISIAAPDGPEFKFSGTATVARHRAYHYYNTTSSAFRMWLARPRFEEVNGNEPSIYDLMGIRLPVPWIERGECFASLSTFHKLGGTTAWDSDIISIQSFTNCHLQIRPGQTTANFMVGLNTDPYADQTYASLDFAWYCYPGGLQIYESGVFVGDFGTYTIGTELGVTYDGSNVRYYLDRTLIRTVAVSGARFYADSSLYTPGCACSVKFGPGTAFESVGTGELEFGAATDTFEVSLSSVSFGPTGASGLSTEVLAVAAPKYPFAYVAVVTATFRAFGSTGLASGFFFISQKINGLTTGQAWSDSFNQSVSSPGGRITMRALIPVSAAEAANQVREYSVRWQTTASGQTMNVSIMHLQLEVIKR